MGSRKSDRVRTALTLVTGIGDRVDWEISGDRRFGSEGPASLAVPLDGFALTYGRISTGSTGIVLEIDRVAGFATEEYSADDNRSVVPHGEGALLRALHDIFRNENQPLLITWRGTEFDIPFLRERFQACGLPTDYLTTSSADVRYGLQDARHVDVWQVQCPDREPLTLKEVLTGAIVPSWEDLTGLKELEVQALGLMLLAGLLLFNEKQMKPSAFLQFLDTSDAFIEEVSKDRPYLDIRPVRCPLLYRVLSGGRG